MMLKTFATFLLALAVTAADDDVANTEAPANT